MLIAVGLSDFAILKDPLFIQNCASSNSGHRSLLLVTRFVRAMVRQPTRILALAYPAISERSTDFRHTEFALQALPLPPPPRATSHRRGTWTTWTGASGGTSAPSGSSLRCWRRRSRLSSTGLSSRGLDPNVGLKPSGVEWLGDVPEHWETFRRAGTLLQSRQRFTHLHVAMPRTGLTEYIHWLKVSSSVNQGTITRADQFVTDLALHE